MKDLSIKDFASLCSQISPATFLFDTNNQVPEDLCCGDTARCVSYYDSVIVMTNPNRMCFRRGESYICFENVIKILLCDKIFDQMFSFIIVCAPTENADKNNVYTMIADKKVG